MKIKFRSGINPGKSSFMISFCPGWAEFHVCIYSLTCINQALESGIRQHWLKSLNRLEIQERQTHRPECKGRPPANTPAFLEISDTRISCSLNMAFGSTSLFCFDQLHRSHRWGNTDFMPREGRMCDALGAMGMVVLRHGIDCLLQGICRRLLITATLWERAGGCLSCCDIGGGFCSLVMMMDDEYLWCVGWLMCSCKIKRLNVVTRTLELRVLVIDLLAMTRVY